MEQTTPVYEYLKNRYAYLVGSEYLGDSVPLGCHNSSGLRNEDATKLSFRDNSIDAILSFDVLEHVYEYKLAFAECARVLRKGACLIFTVPFAMTSQKNIERAVIEDGGIKHLMEPEYHGDPLSDNGILCFRHYGWDMLADLIDSGFSYAHAAIFNSIEFGYYTNQIIFHARK